jgi:hypothetical protein
MNQDPYDITEDEPYATPPRRGRRGGFAVDLTGMGVRLAATALILGVGLLLVWLVVRPAPGEAIEPPPPVVEVPVDLNEPLATFTPGPTSTPPPLDEPTPEPAPEAEQTSGALISGVQARITGTGSAGVNLRADNGTTSEVVRILEDDTPLTLLTGPVEADGYSWWQVQLEDGTTGWVVQDFLAP